MGWRTVYVDSMCKLSYKNDYLIIKTEKISMIHLSEIDTLVLANTAVLLSGVIMCELIKNKIKVIFCDETKNPYGEIMPYYGCHNSYKKIVSQINWQLDVKQWVATSIIDSKIRNQSALLKKYGYIDSSQKLEEYVEEIELMDATNREGHAAKVYFNTLFGTKFNREQYNDINAQLDYGYTILLSAINREVVSSGYITQLGIYHHNEYNAFNFSCDLMEPFRVLIDEDVYNNKSKTFDHERKIEIVNLLNKKVMYGKEYYLTDAISIYVRNVIKVLGGEICDYPRYMYK